ncbi:SUKH-3 domain-containing protein [Streptomyces filamentosus]
MDSTSASPGHAAAWSRLLETYRPRPADEQQGPPSLGCLIEAASRNATLGAMYPWVSMQQLSVSTENSWEEWGRAPLPAMFARPDGYEVVGRDRRGDVVRLATPDPAEAVVFAAGLVRTAGAVRPVEPHAWSSEVERVLREAGWHPGRTVDTAGWKQRLEQDGFRSHAAAEGFLREFGGLAVGHGGTGITRAREPFDLDPLLALGEADRFGGWGEEIGHHLFPVGELAGGHAFLGLDEDGELYVVDDWPGRFGRMPEAMENLVLGVMPVHMPEPKSTGAPE